MVKFNNTKQLITKNWLNYKFTVVNHILTEDKIVQAYNLLFEDVISLLTGLG